MADTDARVAVLVDGENVSQAHAGRILTRALAVGTPTVLRVYGNATLLPAWDSAPRFRLVHAGAGKNATDILLAVEAMALAFSGTVERFCIVSSDRDYTHLVDHLRERGHHVVGMGEAKAPERYRKAFSAWIALDAPVTPAVAAAPPSQPTATAAPKCGTLDQQVAELLRQEGGVLRIAHLGARMHSTYGVRISQRPEKTWRAYLLARSHLYRCDPRGPEARVSLLPSAGH
jgi:hypothetical protein